VIAIEPAIWLFQTWYQPGYEGTGVIAFGLTVGFFLWSCSSPLLHPRTTPATWLLLMVSAILRLVSQLLDINVVGALLLCVDVYAIARIVGVDVRQRSLSPLWLAVLFAFSLPIEPMLQRVFGYGLQLVSAQVSCALLAPFFSDLVCEGVRITLAGRDVLVDLPCSGSELLSLSALVLVGLFCTARPDHRAVFKGLFLWLSLSLLGNGVRIAVLAVGIVYQQDIGIDVMAPLPHTLIGLVIVAGVSSILVAWTLTLSSKRAVSSKRVLSPTKPAARVRRFRYPRLLAITHPTLQVSLSIMFLVFALGVGMLKPQPVDASPALIPPSTPLVVANFAAVEHPLSSLEQTYFSQYGGGAKRFSYGPYGLLLVTTASPLRHLHDPTICLTGAGFDVRLLGTDHVMSSTVYAAKRLADNTVFDVYVSYLADNGHTASSIAEVVWRWFKAPQTRWTMVQRIVPRADNLDEAKTRAWMASINRAYNLSQET